MNRTLSVRTNWKTIESDFLYCAWCGNDINKAESSILQMYKEVRPNNPSKLTGFKGLYMHVDGHAIKIYHANKQYL